MKKQKNRGGTIVGLVFFLLLWVANLLYSHWYLATGWVGPNAIMRYCSQFNDTSLGWFEYIFGHGVLNFVAGYGAIFPLAVPIITIFLLFRRNKLEAILTKLVSLFFNCLLSVATIAGLLYGSLYLMEELPLLAGFLMLIGVCMLIPTGKTVWLIIVETD